MARSSTRIFTYDEALATLPLVREVTTTAIRQIEAIYSRVQSREELERRQEELEGTVNRIVEAWAEEIGSFGCEVKGLWLVDWDNGEGYYCWRYPEDSIGFFHGYEDGFKGRVPVN